jgi:hypothetical protein
LQKKLYLNEIEVIVFSQREGLKTKIKTAAVTQRKLKNETPPKKKAEPKMALLFLFMVRKIFLNLPPTPQTDKCKSHFTPSSMVNPRLFENQGFSALINRYKIYNPSYRLLKTRDDHDLNHTDFNHIFAILSLIMVK